jgi:hypothetical protein
MHLMAFKLEVEAEELRFEYILQYLNTPRV